MIADPWVLDLDRVIVWVVLGEGRGAGSACLAVTEAEVGAGGVVVEQGLDGVEGFECSVEHDVL